MTLGDISPLMRDHILPRYSCIARWVTISAWGLVRGNWNGLFFSSAVESELPVLAFTSFWVAREESGKYHVVIAWFFFEGDAEPKMRGIYSTSEELAKITIEIWRWWKVLSETKIMNRLREILPPSPKHEG